MDDFLEHLEPARIPVRSVVLSFTALLVPVVASTLFPDSAREHEVLLWLVALVPAFLLAYYRGWRGVAIAMAAGMTVLTVTHLYLVLADRRIDNWPLLLAVVTAYIGIGMALGTVTELLHKERERVQRLALVDSLTEAPNRRFADLILDRAFGSAQRGIPLTVVLFDLDEFKSYNDRYGHVAGDRALKVFAEALLRNTRKMNLSARYGGEEFLSIVNNATVEGTLVFVDRVRETLRQAPIALGSVTVSAGVAAYHAGMVEPSDLVGAADEALYQAKEEGPDTVRVYHPTASRPAGRVAAAGTGGGVPPGGERRS